MCQATVFLAEDGTKREVMRDVISLEAGDGEVRIQGFFEAPQVLRAKVRDIDFLKHTVTLEPLAGEGHADDGR